MEELKNCPLCNGQARFYSFGHKNIIYCMGCGLKLEQAYGNKKDIFRLWNSRVNDKKSID